MKFQNNPSEITPSEMPEIAPDLTEMPEVPEDDPDEIPEDEPDEITEEPYELPDEEPGEFPSEIPSTV